MRSFRALTFVLLMLFAISAAASTSGVVISQIYGGGGNAGATYKNDFIELFNAGTAPVSLAGWSVQYASSAGTTWQKTDLTGVTLQPGQYYLVQEAQGAGGTLPLPTPDAVGIIPMSAATAKVALVRNNTLITSGTSCPTTNIEDFVGYGGANCSETAPAPALTNTTGALRRAGGCTDTDNNSADFQIGAPTPRNTASPTQACLLPTNPSGTPNVNPGSVMAGETTLFALSVTPGGNPTSTGITASANFTAIGGTGTETLYDDGTHGDVTAGDNIFSRSFTVAAGTSPATYSLPFNIADAQGRHGIGNFSLTVTPFIPTLAIHDIQGSGITSPYAGQVVITTGIVTARRSNGYFVQTPDYLADADPNTSEGIFVFTSSTPPASAQVGNLVKVQGTIQEFIPAADPLSPSATEFSGSPQTTLVSTGNTLPAPVTLTAADLTPSGGFNQLERYEFMRVYVDSLTATSGSQGTTNEPNATGSNNGVFHAVITGTPRPFRESGIEAPGTPPPSPCCIPQFDGNPERLRVDSDSQPGAAALEVTAGATVTNVTGVLDFGSRLYTINPDPSPTPIVTGNKTYTAAPVPLFNELTVASFNMERFFDTVNDPGTSDAVLTATAFNNRLNKASLTIRNVLRTPDVLGVEEVENLATLQAIADKVNADAVSAGDPDPMYVAYLFEGNDPGGIDVGLLVKSSRVTLIDVTQEGLTATYTNPVTNAQDLLNDRPPIMAHVVAYGNAGPSFPLNLTVIINHLRSLNGVEDADGRVRTKRAKQAEFLANLIQARNATENVVSLGDYNAFEVNDGYADLINTILGNPASPDNVMVASPDLVDPNLTDLASTLPPEERYSYVFDGNAQILDHAIANPNAFGSVTRFTYAHSNAEFPEFYRSDPNRPERLSDHDIPVVYFHLPTDTTPPTVSVTGVSDGASYLLGTAPAAGCSTSDSQSGVATPASLSVTGGSPSGTGTFTATCSGAVDNAGNASAPVSVTYTVVFGFNGFYSPLTPEAYSGAYNAGRTIPVKFSLYDASGTVTTLAAINNIVVAPSASCGIDTGAAGDEAMPAGGSLLRYDGTSGQFIFNWKTTGLPVGCYQLGVILDGGAAHSTIVRLK